MKILAILDNLNQNKTNRKADMTSFGGNNNKFNPSFDGRSVGYHSENTIYYGSNGKMDVVIDDYHRTRAYDCHYDLRGSHYYYQALHYGAEKAIKNHPDCPKNHKIEACYSYSNPQEKPPRLYIADPGEKITDSIRENHAIVVHNFDRKKY